MNVKNALPDSGTNHDTALAHVVAEILGFTTRDYIRAIWGDSAITPPSNGWIAGKTVTVQGAATYSAAVKLKKDLLDRAATMLDVDVAELQIRDGVISSRSNPQLQTTFAALAEAAGGSIVGAGQGVNKSQGRALTKGVGACFLEVEVDTWTGDWRIVRSAYCHDVGLVVNPMVASADMLGSMTQSLQMATDPVPYDREFPGHRHYATGYLAYRLPTIMEMPEHQTQVLVDSLEPRWFYGIKSFSETSDRVRAGRGIECHLQCVWRADKRNADHAGQDPGGIEREGGAGMKKVSIYRPASMDEAIQILTLHGTEGGGVCGGERTC